MKEKILETYEKVGYTRYKRIENYIKLLETSYDVKSEKDAENIKELKFLIFDTLKAVKILSVVITISYLGIYFSAISAIFSTGTVLPFLTEAVGKIVGFFGTTLFMATLLIANKLNELYYQDLNLLTSHLIVLYNKHKLNKDTLFDAGNAYHSFIKFFKKSF